MSRGRLVADGPLAGLCGLAFLVVGGLVVLATRQTFAYDPFVACATLATTFVARLSSLGFLGPIGLISAMLLAGALALVHQAWATRWVLGEVLGRTRAADDRLTALARRAGLGGRLELVDDDAVYTFCYGFLRPRVCVTSGLASLLADDELAAVLRHEAHHLRHRDPLKMLLGRTVASALFFLPVAGALRNSFLAGKEICADADAGTDLALARALVKMLRSERPAWPAGVLAIGAFSPTEARLERLIRPEAARLALPSAVDWIVSLALVAGIFGFSVGAAAASQAAPLQEACAVGAARAARAPAPTTLPVLEAVARPPADSTAH